MKIAILYLDGRGFDIIDTDDYNELEPQEIIELEYPAATISWCVLDSDAFIEIVNENHINTFFDDGNITISLTGKKI